MYIRTGMHFLVNRRGPDPAADFPSAQSLLRGHRRNTKKIFFKTISKKLPNNARINGFRKFKKKYKNIFFFCHKIK